LPVGFLLVHRQRPLLDNGPRQGAAHIQPHENAVSYREATLVVWARRPRAHGQDDKQQLGHGQVPGRAVDEAQQAVAAIGLGHVREQEVSGRKRANRERVRVGG